MKHEQTVVSATAKGGGRVAWIALLVPALCACGAGGGVTTSRRDAATMLTRPSTVVACSTIDSTVPPEFLPRTVESRPATGSPGAACHYETRLTYHKGDVPVAVNLFNPFVILGFPTGDASVDGTAALSVHLAGAEVSRYEAECEASSLNTVYSGTDYSNLRSRCLTALREQIEAKMSAGPPSPETLEENLR